MSPHGFHRSRTKKDHIYRPRVITVADTTVTISPIYKRGTGVHLPSRLFTFSGIILDHNCVRPDCDVHHARKIQIWQRTGEQAFIDEKIFGELFFYNLVVFLVYIFALS